MGIFDNERSEHTDPRMLIGFRSSMMSNPLNHSGSVDPALVSACDALADHDPESCIVVIDGSGVRTAYRRENGKVAKRVLSAVRFASSA